MIVSTTTWEERRLCDDGGCTGLIGNDGLCRTCGRASQFWGDERRRGMKDDDDEAPAPADGGPGAADDDDRDLCPDGGCTGLLDDTGRCKVCGKVDERARGLVRSSVTASVAADAHAGAGAGEANERERERDDDNDDDRRLCPDGGCTGLLGADGACKVCGRRAEA